MEVSPHVDAVVHRVVHAGYGVKGVIDSPAVIGSGDAIFGDDYRRAFGDVPSMADGDAQRRREVLPAGEGAFRVLGDRHGAILADEGPQIGLHPNEVIPGRGLGEVVLARVLVFLHLPFASGHGVERLAGDGPPGLDTRVLGQYFPGFPVRFDERGGDVRIGRGQRGGHEVAAFGSATGQRDHVRLVNGADPGDVVEDRHHVPHVPGEVVDGIGVEPSALGGEPQRQCHVVQRDHGLDAVLVARVDHLAVVQQLRFGEAALRGLDAGPFDGEAVHAQSGVGEHSDVLAVAVVAVGRVSRRFAEIRAFGMLPGPPVARDVVSFDLVRGRGRAPDEFRRELVLFFHDMSFYLMPVPATPWMK